MFVLKDKAWALHVCQIKLKAQTFLLPSVWCCCSCMQRYFYDGRDKFLLSEANIGKRSCPSVSHTNAHSSCTEPRQSLARLPYEQKTERNGSSEHNAPVFTLVPSSLSDNQAWSRFMQITESSSCWKVHTNVTCFKFTFQSSA